MLQFKSLAGKREAVVGNPSYVTLTPTVGGFKLGEEVLKKLDVVDGDRIDVAVATNEEGVDVVYLCKGKRATEKKDDEGNPMFSGSGKQQWEEDGQGLVVRIAVGASSVGSFTASAAWGKAGGDKDFNTHYELGEGVEAPLENYPDIMTTYYPLVYKEKVEKVSREQGIDNQEEVVEAEASDNDDF